MMPSGPDRHEAVFYFAYGSNLCVRRLGRRAPGVITLGVTSLEGYALRWHKRGADGSGKCTIVRSSVRSTVVHGALFLIPKESMVRLDEVEGLGAGYEKASVPVRARSGTVGAHTYVASPSHVDEALRPYRWYRDLVVSGAAALGLPRPYVARLRKVETWEDIDRGRARRNLVSLPCQPGGARR
jgi:gamma-glutamylcyclotransferase